MDLSCITFRKPRKSKSLNNITIENISVAESSGLFDTTILSMPYTLNDSQTVDDIKAKNSKLTEELQSALQEIENLNYENTQLKSELAECHKIIKAYKKVTMEERPQTPLSVRSKERLRTSSLTSTPLKNAEPQSETRSTHTATNDDCRTVSTAGADTNKSLLLSSASSTPIKKSIPESRQRKNMKVLPTNKLRNKNGDKKITTISVSKTNKNLVQTSGQLPASTNTCKIQHRIQEKPKNSPKNNKTDTKVTNDSITHVQLAAPMAETTSNLLLTSSPSSKLTDTSKPQSELLNKEKIVPKTNEIHCKLINEDKDVQLNSCSSKQVFQNDTEKEPTCLNQEIEQAVNNKPVETNSTDNLKPLKIMILGDQLVKGLSSSIRIKRQNQWNDVYTVFSTVKPHATAAQVLSSCESLLKTLNSDDIVILGIGSNEKNPYSMLSELSTALHKLKQYRVFVLNVYDNPYLNVKLLNNSINLVTQNYTNCKFINTFGPKHSPILQQSLDLLCFKINIEINYLEYNKLYIVKENAKTPLLLNAGKKSIKANTHRFKVALIQKTIPYYFNRLNGINNNQGTSPTEYNNVMGKTNPSDEQKKLVDTETQTDDDMERMSKEVNNQSNYNFRVS